MSSELPNLAETFSQLLQLVSPDQQPLLIAIAERLAADRYRVWADAVTEPDRKAGLLACAAREDEIARRVEGLFPDASAVQQQILASNPGLHELNRSLFEPYTLQQQWTLQAQGERLGAATWRALARQQEDYSRRDTLMSCAVLEEASAAFLESLA